MPELHFKGKEFVYNHHLSVPYRPLVIDNDKSVGAAHDLNNNLIVHGDNLHALKALMPLYAGKVDCVFIDPPYNTGNKDWSYNDNVNSPMLKEWLAGNPISIEDALRHDKWLAMMYPRIKLLYELMSDTSSFWITLDDNEVHRAKAILDEIFGEEKFLANVIWQHSVQGKGYTNKFSVHHNHLLVYSKGDFSFDGLDRTDEDNVNYSNPDNDPRGDWRVGDVRNSLFRPNLKYELTTPSGKIIQPPENGWRWKKETMQQKIDSGEVLFIDDESKILRKIYLDAQDKRAAETIWFANEVGSTRDATAILKDIFGGESPFATPKPLALLERILELATDDEAIILDSFAGSGTTAHAVLSANAKDKGSRKFILVEGESYANSLTAERVRRVIDGYDYQGVKREELHREKLSYKSLKKAEKLIEHIASIENLESHRFDSIKKEVKDGELIVTGEKNITEKVEGLGGSFTYCTLGEPIDLDGILTGQNLPSYEAIGSWLFHTATGDALDASRIDKANWYLGETSAFYVWLIYKPELEFLKSRDSALTLNLAENIAKAKQGKKHLVFAPAKFVPNKTLLPLGVEYAPLPFSLYKLER